MVGVIFNCGSNHIRLVYAFPVGRDFYSNISDLQLFCVDDREIAAMEEAFAAFQAALKGGEVQVVTVEICIPALLTKNRLRPGRVLQRWLRRSV
jgi:hypothetical protein